MNVVICLTIAAGTVYLVKRCLLGREVEVKEGSRSRVPQTELSASGTTLMDRNLNPGLTLEAHQTRLTKLKDLNNVISQHVGPTMEVDEFIKIMDSLIQLFNENGDISHWKNREFCNLCVDSIQQCIGKLKSKSLCDDKKHGAWIRQLLKCFSDIYKISDPKKETQRSTCDIFGEVIDGLLKYCGKRDAKKKIQSIIDDFLNKVDWEAGRRIVVEPLDRSSPTWS